MSKADGFDPRDGLAQARGDEPVLLGGRDLDGSRVGGQVEHTQGVERADGQGGTGLEVPVDVVSRGPGDGRVLGAGVV
jgi:hypothetical protein